MGFKYPLVIFEPIDSIGVGESSSAACLLSIVYYLVSSLLYCLSGEGEGDVSVVYPSPAVSARLVIASM